MALAFYKRRLIRSLKTASDYYLRRLDPEVQTFCEEWLSDRDFNLRLLAVALGSIFHGLSLVLDPWFTDRQESVLILRYTHLAAFVAMAVSLFSIIRTRKATTITLVISSLGVSISGYIYLLYYYVSLNPRIDIVVIRVWMVLVSLSVVHILLVPSHRLWQPVFFMLCLTLANAVAWLHSPFAAQIIPLSVVVFILPLAFHWSQSVKSVQDALREFEARKKMMQIERSRIERELELAREIQDSLAPPPSLSVGGITAVCFQKKHSEVGGDWAAIRRTEGDGLYVVVADAAGKGMQAALVVHAVQSLWAETLGRPGFDPSAWLERVNHALCQLGEKQRHMVTMGIVEINSRVCRYWRAGHLPLFVLSVNEAGVEHVGVLSGQGAPLGLAESLRVEPTQMLLDAHSSISFMLGSDGTFEKGSHHRRREIIAIRDGIRMRGAAVLEERPANDDKTLIWIDHKAA